MAVELNHTIVPAHDPQGSAQFLAGRIRDRGITYYAGPACRQPGQVYANKNGHLMEILTPISGEPA